jgi:hypothetical protein
MEEQFKKGFFEFIAAADAEKVHSQTIGWIFSDNCNAISSDDKSKLLRLLSNSNSEMRIEKVFVELYDIDILVVCNDCFVVFENKIKTEQHNDQLNKYLYLTSENGNNINGFDSFSYEREKLRDKLNGLKENYIFLTLLNENSRFSAGGKYHENSWTDVSYKKFTELLNNQVNLIENDHGVILNNYLRTIRNLTNALTSIEKDIEVIRWIFENGSFTQKKRFELELSSELSYPNETCKFISESGLVRFAQKYYYKVVCDIIEKSSDELNLEVNLLYGSSEMSGAGLIHIDFPQLSFKANGRKYKIGYQLQGKSEKINLADADYQNSGEKEVELFNRLIDVRPKLDELKRNLNFEKRNPGRSKPYHGISNKLDDEILSYKPTEVAEHIIDTINNSQNYLEDFFISISSK